MGLHGKPFLFKFNQGGKIQLCSCSFSSTCWNEVLFGFLTLHFNFVPSPRAGVITLVKTARCLGRAITQRKSCREDFSRKVTTKTELNVFIHKQSHDIGGELLRSKEEGGKTSNQCFIMYLSRLIMLKMYRQRPDASFARFLMIEMLKHCLA